MTELELRKHYRPIARQRAEEFNRKVREAALSGQNHYQVSVDLQDEDAVFLASLPVEDRELFELMYSEELNALTSKTNDEASSIEANTEATVAAWQWVIAAAIGFIFLVMIF